MRLCPQCGNKIEDLRCPTDGTSTLLLTAGPPEWRFSVGQEVNGRYRIGPVIGQGGFGAVYRATSRATGQDVALKVLSVALDGNDAEVVQRFFAEAQITASLQHPNTIRVFDFGQTEGGALFIAMELLQGQTLMETLDARLKAGQVLSQTETVRIGTQVLRSLGEAHLAALVHRDLKPQNIFLHEVKGDDPVVKVLDFGIAKRLGQKFTSTGQSFGTPHYMSPEHARGWAIDGRSDLYALGVVLYQCVAGRTPFEFDDAMQVLLAHVTETAPNLRLAARTPVSEGFVRVLERVLAKDPQQRFGSAIEMRQALEQLRDEPAVASLRDVATLPEAIPAYAPRLTTHVSMSDDSVGFAVPPNSAAPGSDVPATGNILEINRNIDTDAQPTLPMSQTPVPSNRLAPKPAAAAAPQVVAQPAVTVMESSIPAESPAARAPAAPVSTPTPARPTAPASSNHNLLIGLGFAATLAIAAVGLLLVRGRSTPPAAATVAAPTAAVPSPASPVAAPALATGSPESPALPIPSAATVAQIAPPTLPPAAELPAQATAAVEAAPNGQAPESPARPAHTGPRHPKGKSAPANGAAPGSAGSSDGFKLD